MNLTLRKASFKQYSQPSQQHRSKRPVSLREPTPLASQQRAYARCALRGSLTGHDRSASPIAVCPKGKGPQ